MIEVIPSNVYMNMSAVHTSLHSDSSSSALADERFSWSAQVKLAVVLSAIAAMVASALVGRVDESHIVVGTIVIASLMGWSRVQFAPQSNPQPAPVHVRHR